MVGDLVAYVIPPDALRIIRAGLKSGRDKNPKDWGGFSVLGSRNYASSLSRCLTAIFRGAKMKGFLYSLSHKAMPALLVVVLLVALSLTCSAGWFGPSDYNECVLENIGKAHSGSAAHAIRQACANKFHERGGRLAPPGTRCRGGAVERWWSIVAQAGRWPRLSAHLPRVR
jgi:hypothetical protein